MRGLTRINKIECWVLFIEKLLPRNAEKSFLEEKNKPIKMSRAFVTKLIYESKESFLLALAI